MWQVRGLYLAPRGGGWSPLPEFFIAALPGEARAADRGRDKTAGRAVEVMSAGGRHAGLYEAEMFNVDADGKPDEAVSWTYSFNVDDFDDGEPVVRWRGRAIRTIPCERYGCDQRVRLATRPECDECGASYNAFGQRLRDNWQDNASNYNDEIGDMDGYEAMYAGDE